MFNSDIAQNTSNNPWNSTAPNSTTISLKSNAGTPEVLFPSAEAMLAIGVPALEQDQGVAAEDAQPVYVRDTVSWKKLPGRE